MRCHQAVQKQLTAITTSTAKLRLKEVPLPSATGKVQRAGCLTLRGLLEKTQKEPEFPRTGLGREDMQRPLGKLTNPSENTSSKFNLALLVYFLLSSFFLLCSSALEENESTISTLSSKINQTPKKRLLRVHQLQT